MENERNTKEKIIDTLENKEREIVINRCCGGFGISNETLLELIKMNSKIIEKHTIKKYYRKDWEKEWERTKEHLIHLKGKFFKHELFDGWLTDKKFIYSLPHDEEIRDNPDLIKVIKKLKIKANGKHAKLEIRKIPLNVKWEIVNYEGIETIHEKHRSW